MAERSNAVVYVGVRRPAGCVIVRIDEDGTVHKLNTGRSLKLANKSPTGFEWGYGGSGPAQTALALLLDWTDDSERALSLYQDFKWHTISKLGDVWQISGQQISDAISRILASGLASTHPAS